MTQPDRAEVDQWFLEETARLVNLLHLKGDQLQQIADLRESLFFSYLKGFNQARKCFEDYFKT